MSLIARAAETVKKSFDARPTAAVVLGSGLSGFAASRRPITSIPFAYIPGFPPPSVEGHQGTLEVHGFGGGAAVVLRGRVHLYEGWAPHEVVFPVRVMSALGVPAIILTNAAGGIRAGLDPGSLMLISDHINFTGQNPLEGPNIDSLGQRFPDLAALWDPVLIEQASKFAYAAGVEISRGVYAGVRGPAYESPAEIEMLRRLGADAVGMSTVHEAIAGFHAGMRVIGLSVITNHAASRDGCRMTHAEVLETAGKASQNAGVVIEAILEELGWGR